MKSPKHLISPCLYYAFAIILTTTNSVFGQTPRQENMGKLRFMVGEWVGISTTYNDDTVATQIPAFESISYKLDQNIITIDLYSELLQLHTVIYYNEKDEKYYYNPYYKSGAGRYDATYRNGKLIVQPNENKRFVFHLTPEGNLQEYGEKREDGKWVRYFEDNFKRMP